MKKRRIKFIIISALIIALICLVALASCGAFEIAQLNRLSATGMKLGERFPSGGSAGGYTEVPNEYFGGSMYASADGGETLTVAGYPDCISNARITGITLNSADHNILGIRIGDESTTAYAALEKAGYRILSSGLGAIRAGKGRITVVVDLEAGHDRVAGINAHLENTNIFRIQY